MKGLKAKEVKFTSRGIKMQPPNRKADLKNKKRLRYSVSRVTQGSHVFYTLTIPSNVLARTCAVTNRIEDPKKGFQRTLSKKRASDIAKYIDDGSTIPSSIVLSAQPEAGLAIVGKGKTLEFNDTERAFLILDGQHRVYGFSLAKTSLRVPVVIYNGLSRRDESRLFIDINTKQKPVPTALLLDIKKLAERESDTEAELRKIFDLFHENSKSSLFGLLSPSESKVGTISRVTFNQAMKPLLEIFSARDANDTFDILNSYFDAAKAQLDEKFAGNAIAKPVIFRAFTGLFPIVAGKVQDRFDGEYSAQNFATVLEPVFNRLPRKKIESPGTSWTSLRDYLEERLKRKLVL